MRGTACEAKHIEKESTKRGGATSKANCGKERGWQAREREREREREEANSNKHVQVFSSVVLSLSYLSIRVLIVRQRGSRSNKKYKSFFDELKNFVRRFFCLSFFQTFERRPETFRGSPATRPTSRRSRTSRSDSSPVKGVAHVCFAARLRLRHSQEQQLQRKSRSKSDF